MIQIQSLDWDSNFFGYKVGKINLIDINFDEILKIDTQDYKLIYLFSAKEIPDEILDKISGKLVDIKVELIKKTSKEIANNPINFQVKKINVLTDELIKLVFESGIYSRYRLDQNFINNEFERMYRAWIQKSLTDSNSEVIGVFDHNELIGFISLSLKNGIADIGLIAVDEKARGLKIGSKLLDESNIFALKNKSEFITVVTQANNIQAMRLYERNGFEIKHKNYIYHIWKKTT